MQNYRPFIAILLLFVGVSCKEQEEAPTGPVDLIRFDSNNLLSTDEQASIVVWNSDGTLIGVQKYDPNAVIKFTTEQKLVDNKFSMGLFIFRSGGGTSSFRTRIFTDLTPGMVINDSPEPSGSVTANGTFKITLKSSLPAGSFLNVSSKLGGGGYASSGNVYTVNFDPRTDRYLATYRSNDKVYYKHLTNVKANDALSIGLDEFKLFEKTATFNVPSPYTSISIAFTGYEADVPYGGGYALASYSIGAGSATTFTAGYFDVISKFTTTLTVGHNGKSFRYFKRGSLPANISWPGSSAYNAISFNPKSPVGSASAPFRYMASVWSYNNAGIVRQLQIYSMGVSPKIGDVPAEILTEHPDFAINESNFSSASLTFWVGQPSVEEYISSILTVSSAVETEEMSVSIPKN